MNDFELPAAPAVTDAQIEEMNRDLADAIRCNAELSEAELILLAEKSERDTMATLTASLAAVKADQDETKVEVSGYRFKAFAKLAGGRWQKAGYHSYADEPSAWCAAREKLADLRRSAKLPA